MNKFLSGYKTKDRDNKGNKFGLREENKATSSRQTVRKNQYTEHMTQKSVFCIND
jgi:hypothetical protein